MAKRNFAQRNFKQREFLPANWTGVGPVITTGPAIVVVKDGVVYSLPMTERAAYAIQLQAAAAYAVQVVDGVVTRAFVSDVLM